LADDQYKPGGPQPSSTTIVRKLERITGRKPAWPELAPGSGGSTAWQDGAGDIAILMVAIGLALGRNRAVSLWSVCEDQAQASWPNGGARPCVREAVGSLKRDLSRGCWSCGGQTSRATAQI